MSWSSCPACTEFYALCCSHTIGWWAGIQPNKSRTSPKPNSNKNKRANIKTYFIFIKKGGRRFLFNTRLPIQNEENCNNKRKCSHHVCRLVVCVHHFVHPSFIPLQPNPPKNDRGQFRNQNESIHKLVFNLFLKNETRAERTKWQKQK